MKTLSLIVLAVGFALAQPAQANEAAFQKAGCNACHTKDKKLVGPALQDIAKKYKGQADIVAKLVAKVRSGGKDVWGPIPMPPNDAAKISDADLAATVEWILKL
jgi:cytochrome c